ncbi:glycosyltransferase [Alkalihalobacillus sp. BA299]|uniref:glycosyltransferase n=1 Tax=Alkalihalobacillus sp. BA299 TaxID=2815938 RepID=UPI001ADBDB9C|nr:glycosyltransferase [Alkalihalobacillus sp. BA299]
MNVVMVLFKDILYDARVQREAIALAEGGYQVTIFCVKEHEKTLPSLHGNIVIRRLALFTKSAKMKMNGSGTATSSRKVNMIKAIVRSPMIKLVKEVAVTKAFYNKIKQSLSNQNVDVIHCHDLNTLPIGHWLSKDKEAKLIYDSHELYNEMAGRTAFDQKIGYKLERSLMKKIDHLIVVNPYVKAEFETRYGQVPTTVIQNIPLVEKAKLVEELSKNYWREKFNLTDDDIILIYQGGMNPNRGIEDCIQALKELPDHYKLVLLGEGTIKQNLVDAVLQLGLSARVFFHDQVPSADILWYTKQADIGLVMYQNNSLNNYLSTPNKIFEYLLAGIPMVASNHPGKSYIIEPEEIGICVEESPAEIKRGIEYIMENYDFYKETCRKKRTLITWEEEGQKLVNAYKSLS